MDLDVENQNTFTSVCPPESSSRSSTPDVLPPENHDVDLTHHPPRFGAIIPNRIFVGGIDCKADETELSHFFSQYGPVKDVKIVIDRSGIPKGYGFVSFETKEDALKVLNNTDGICFKNKRLSIGPAVHKHQGPNKSVRVASPDSAMPLPMSHGPLYHTMSTGYPYTCPSRGPYFHCPSMNLPSHHWPRFAPPVMFSLPRQPVYQQPTCHYYQCVPSPYQFSVVQSPMPSGPVMCSQLLAHRKPADGGSVQPSPPEDTAPENEIVSPSHVHRKPKCHQSVNDKDCHDPPEATETPDDSLPQATQAST